MNREALIALKEKVEAAGLRVKPLTWRGPFACNGYRKGRWDAGEFSVQKQGNGVYRVYRGFLDRKDALYQTKEDAMAAAQADYESSILSALIAMETDREEPREETKEGY